MHRHPVPTKLREYAAVGAFLGGALLLFTAFVGYAMDLSGALWAYLLGGLLLPPLGYALWPYKGQGR